MKPRNIRKDNECVDKLVKIIQDNLNPFDASEPNHLFNLATGKSAKKETEDFVLNIAQICNEKRKQFISECIETPERFEKAIKREKLQTFATFATEAGKKDYKQEWKAYCIMLRDRDIWEYSFFIPAKKGGYGRSANIPINSSATCPEPCKWIDVNNRGIFADENLRRKSNNNPSVCYRPNSNRCIFLFVLTEGSSCDSNSVTTKNHGFRWKYIIHFIADKWLQPSIKDSERDVRNSTQASYQIKGPEQKQPSNWIDSMKNPNFKIALNKYLIDAWRDNSLAGIFGTKTLYANCGDKCYKYTANGVEVVREEEPRVFSTHEEADSPMFHHVAFSNRENHCSGPVNIFVRTNNTDCLVISLLQSLQF